MSDFVIAFVLELILLYLISLIFYYLMLLIRKTKIQDRFKDYVINSKETEVKLFDLFVISINNLIKRISKFLYKIKVFNKYSLKYQKYISKEEKNIVDRMDFVSKKIIISIMFLLIVILYDAFIYRTIIFFQIVISLVVGFYLLDIFLLSSDKFLKRQRENDLLKAITIMNNAFKSGHSIMQAIKLVSEELNSPLGLEFKKMYIDLTYGLDLNIVFKRFENRVNMSEVKYITASLSILNNTGGDIVKVFESVEKTFFNNKKLNDELKNLTAASKLLSVVLIIIPVLFVVVIYSLDNTYFYPFFRNGLGYLIVLVCFTMYILYIVIIRRLMKIGDDYD